MIITINYFEKIIFLKFSFLVFIYTHNEVIFLEVQLFHWFIRKCKPINFTVFTVSVIICAHFTHIYQYDRCSFLT